MKCYKQKQKEYMTRDDWVGKVNRRELCKKVKLENISKWYTHTSESILEYGTHKIP